MQELAEPEVGSLPAERAQFVHLGRPSGWNRVAQAPQHDLGRHGVEVHVTTGGKERELELHGTLDVSSRTAEQCPEAAVESELLAVRADEVQDGADRLAWCLAEPATELLQEQRGALGWPQHDHRVDRGNVDAFVEQIDREHNADASLCQIPEGGLPLRTRAVAPDGDGRDAVAIEVMGHEAGVLDAHAEAEGAHRRGLCVLGDLLDDEAGPRVGTGVGVAERVDVVAAAPAPWNLAQVEAVVNSEVEKRRQVLLVDRLPKPKLGGDAIVEPLQDR